MKTDRGVVPAHLMLGLDTALFSSLAEVTVASALAHNEQDHHNTEVDVVTLEVPRSRLEFHEAAFRLFIEQLPKDSFYRIKGIIYFSDSGAHLINVAFGRYETPLKLTAYAGSASRLSFVGIGMHAPHVMRQIADGMGVELACISPVC